MTGILRQLAKPDPVAFDPVAFLAIVKRLSDEINRIVKTSDLAQAMAAQGTSPVSNTPEEFAAFIKSEQVKFSKLVKESGIKLD